MKLVVGLGNPGDTYTHTRHNAGFMVVDRLQPSGFKMSAKLGADIAKQGEMIFCKPQKYMNVSGQVVRAVMDFYQIRAEDVVVIHDDLDIELGNVKMQLGKGPKIHNGVTSIEQALGTKEFWRIRVGVDSRGLAEKHIPGKDYVLSRMRDDEVDILESVTDEVVGRALGEIVG